MQRLISLFREAEEVYAPSRAIEHPPQPPGVREPIYFVQLLEYLRQRREAISALERQNDCAQQN